MRLSFLDSHERAAPIPEAEGVKCDTGARLALQLPAVHLYNSRAWAVAVQYFAVILSDIVIEKLNRLYREHLQFNGP